MHAILCITIAIAAISGPITGTPTNSTNVTKREVLEFYPDWVPFKNKHGDELGEFVDVTKPKAKVKKRLAPPMNFLMRAVSDDNDDYIGQGESDSEDYYDKKDWSDVNRPIYNTTGRPVIKDTSDIDGVINIITQTRPSLAEDINKSIQTTTNKDQDETTQSLKVLRNVDEFPSSTPESELKAIDVFTPKPKIDTDNDYDEDTESTTKKSELTEQERKENEEKKRIILDSVDQLKERHAKEQRLINEKTKEEEFDNEFRHNHLQIKKNRANYDRRQRGRPTPPNYDEYEDMSWKDKYSINVEKKTTTDKSVTVGSTKITTSTQVTSQTQKPANLELGKYSVFRNPSLYMVEMDDLNDKESTAHKVTKAPRRFSARYSSTDVKNKKKDNAENNVTVSNATEEETVKPILYFPKMKPKRKLKKTKSVFNAVTTTIRTTSIATTAQTPDSYGAETVEDKLTNKRTTQAIIYPDTTSTYTDKTSAVDNDNPTSTDSLWKDDDTAARKETSKEDTTIFQDKQGTTFLDTTASYEDKTISVDIVPTGYSAEGAEADSSNAEPVTDAVPASSDHKKEEPKDYHVEKGGGSEHHSSHGEEHEEHGKKAYEGLHRNSKNKKGHHDKENHIGSYEDHGGHDKKHHDESGHYGAHHHEEHGKKHAKYEESGKHSKGHSTKGSHDIHKKEEYEKKVEFFEEEGDSGEEEKHGGYHDEKEHSLGGLFKKANLQKEHHEKKKGESGHFLKGGHHKVNKGHKLSGGHDGHGNQGSAHHGGGGQQSGKKWVYHHGSPAKNANLIVIDRRTDRYMHGPTYYG